MRRTKHPDRWWALHNLVAHPVSEVCHWLDRAGIERAGRFGNWIHDATVPDHETGAGRG